MCSARHHLHFDLLTLQVFGVWRDFLGQDLHQVFRLCSLSNKFYLYTEFELYVTFSFELQAEIRWTEREQYLLGGPFKTDKSASVCFLRPNDDSRYSRETTQRRSVKSISVVRS